MNEDPPGKSLGTGMLTLAWILTLGLLTLYFGHWEQKQYNPNTSPRSQVGTNFKEVILESNRQHHYVVSGYINGHEVTFLLDTGASDVVISAQLARKLNLKPGARGFAQTANGTIEVRATKLKSLEVGVIQLENVRASINPAMDGDEVLLGMSALRQVEFIQRGNQLTLRQYPQQ
ncbi:MAG: TIGR02281 family clan AA aspartic protease [Exilibacterium sp.]